MVNLNLTEKVLANIFELGGDTSFYSKVYKFHRNVAVIWKGKAEAASILVPPFTLEYETTNKGAAKVILSLLLFFGILEGTESSNGVQHNVQKTRLSQSAKDIYLVKV